MDNSQELLSCRIRAPCRTKDAATLTRGRSLFQHFCATKSGPSWIQLTCACWRERPAVLHLTHCVASSHLYHLCLSTESKSIACATIRVPRKGGGGVGSEVSVSNRKPRPADQCVGTQMCLLCSTLCSLQLEPVWTALGQNALPGATGIHILVFTGMKQVGFHF